MSRALLLARYSMAGAVNGLVSYTVIFVCMELGLSPGWSNALGYGVGLISSFLQSRHWVFRSTGKLTDDWMRFVLVFIVSYAANFATLKSLLAIGINAYLAQLVACGAYVGISFVLNSTFTFRKRH